MQVLKNVKAYVDGEIVKCDIAFENGVIKEIGKNLDTYKAKEISVDKYSVVCPGFIDEHIHGAAGADGMDVINAMADAGSVIEAGKGYTGAATAFGKLAGRTVAFVYTGKGDTCDKRMQKIARFVRFADC